MKATHKNKKFKYTLSEKDKLDSDKLIKILKLDNINIIFVFIFVIKVIGILMMCSRYS